MTKLKTPLAILILVLSSQLIFAKDVAISSPDGRYLLKITDSNNKIEYSIAYDGKEVISPSQLGIKLGNKFLDGLKIQKASNIASHDEVWKPVYGERSEIRDHYNSMTVTVSRTSDEKDRPAFAIDIRTYDEGAAFRYSFLGGSYIRITDEYTEYTLPEGTLAYFTQRAQTEHQILPLEKWPGDGQSDRPLLLKLPDGRYACLAEARVVDYVRTKFALSDKPNTIRTAMYGPVEDIAPYASPWRLVMCADNAGTFIENNYIFYNLNDPCKIKDPSWIKPGKIMREVTLSTKGAKELVDFAVKHKLQYIHFDAGWYGNEYDKASDATTVTLDPKRNPNPNDLDLQEVIRYAKSKGIGVFVYVNMRALEQQLDDILPLYKSWGISGIKFGFVQVGSQVWTRWLHEAVKKCADYGLMVDIHDEYRPTGFSRTYPNLLTQEGVRGNEEFPDGFNNTVLPFTRFVAGPADYTICYYRQDFGKLGNSKDNYGVPRSKTLKTTPAHQLALSVVYYSPLQFMYWYDKPSDSQDEPELKFFDDVYTVWDDTKVLNGVPGEYATIARRHGDEWFIGSITNEASTQTIDLGFLPKGRYVAEIYTDGDKTIPTRTKVNCETRNVTKSTILKFNLKSCGGAAIRIVPRD